MWCNTQASYSTSPLNARSESHLNANPLNAANLVGASKKFRNPATYDFTLAAYYSFDGGESWGESAPFTLLGNADPRLVWSGISDPVVAWDNAGNAYLVALPFPPEGGYNTLGMAVYKSADGGRTWSGPNFIHQSTRDDKQWAAGDRSPGSPYYGRVYLAWDDGNGLAFARSWDHGTSWHGVGTSPVGFSLANDSFSPSISVASDGTVYIFWLAGIFGSTIKFVKSTNGGDTFSAPQVVVSSLSDLDSPPLPYSGSFPLLPGGHFRVLTVPTGATGSGQQVAVAWADLREGPSRIYYRRSTTGGSTWLGPASGQPLLAAWQSPGSSQHDFHPQLASTPGGEIACAFYEFGPKWSGGPPWINVMMATSHDGGASFGQLERVSNVPWDPTIDAPLSHGEANTTFIGEYFGLAASPRGFTPFWTDTRTGIQEMFSGRRMTIGPWNGVQFRGRLPAGATQRWFTWGWPACWHVLWTVVPTTVRNGAPEITWRVQVERASSGAITYWIVITNLTGQAVDAELRYSILAAD
jgi:hypothetical protein